MIVLDRNIPLRTPPVKSGKVRFLFGTLSASQQRYEVKLGRLGGINTPSFFESITSVS